MSTYVGPSLIHYVSWPEENRVCDYCKQPFDVEKAERRYCLDTLTPTESGCSWSNRGGSGAIIVLVAIIPYPAATATIHITLALVHDDR